MFHQTLRSILVLLLVQLLAVAGHAQFGRGGTAKRLELNETYQRLFLVRYDPELLPLSHTLLTASMSNELTERALVAAQKSAQAEGPDGQYEQIESHVRFGHKVIGGGGLSPVNKGLYFAAEQNMAQGTKVCHLVFSCTSDLDPNMRQQIWTAVVAELETMWRKEQQSALKQRLDRLSESFKPLWKKRDEARAKLDHAMQEHIDLMVATGTSTDQLLEALQNASKDKRRIQMELSGENALREALEHRITILQKETGQAIEEDEICRELKAIIGLQETGLEDAMALFKVGKIQPAKVASAKTALANARVEYLRARQQASQSAGTEELAALNHELADLSMQVVKQKAILQAILEQSEELKIQLAEQLRAEMNLDRMKQQIELLKDQFTTLSQRLAEMELEEETVQPLTVTPWGK